MTGLILLAIVIVAGFFAYWFEKLTAPVFPEDRRKKP